MSIQNKSGNVFCSVLQCVAVCCSVLQCVAVCCSVLQCVAVCCGLFENKSYNEHSKQIIVNAHLIIRWASTMRNCCKNLRMRIYNENILTVTDSTCAAPPEVPAARRRLKHSKLESILMFCAGTPRCCNKTVRNSSNRCVYASIDPCSVNPSTWVREKKKEKKCVLGGGEGEEGVRKSVVFFCMVKV